jgi:hypothetical protein
MGLKQSIKQAEDKLLPCLLVPEKLPNSSQNVSKHPIQSSHLSHSSNHWWAFRSTLGASRVIASGFFFQFFNFYN